MAEGLSPTSRTFTASPGTQLRASPAVMFCFPRARGGRPGCPSPRAHPCTDSPPPRETPATPPYPVARRCLELIRKRIRLITLQILRRGMLSQAEQPSHLPLGRHLLEPQPGKADPAPRAAPRTCKTTKYLQPRANTLELQRCHLNAPGQEHLVPATDSLIIQAVPQSQGWHDLACHRAPASAWLSDMSSPGGSAPARL